MDPQIRKKCKTMFSSALKDTITNSSLEICSKLGDSIETEIFNVTDNITSYNKLFIKKYLNLKEESNRWIPEGIYFGKIPIERFVAMTGEEMKSQELKDLEEKIQKRSLLDSIIAKEEAETDMFFCNRCKERKCTYRQLQTRSADEPMTTFVHCVVCDNHWKFS
ncbi:transcription elongation factor S-II [Nematocida sp. AWRm80]|nr:transcription elongation factor S-II [Nematocida sp. AWRm80]